MKLAEIQRHHQIRSGPVSAVRPVPELSRFLGIMVAIYYRDHAPPHFHAVYGEHEGTIDIRTGGVTGYLPPRVLGHLEEWRQMHEAELLVAWSRTQAGLPPGKIEPLE